VSWKYLMGVLETFNGCPRDILYESWRYLMSFLEIFDVFPGYI